MLPFDFHLGLFLTKSILLEAQETGLHMRQRRCFLRSFHVDFRPVLHLGACQRNPCVVHSVEQDTVPINFI